MTPSDKVLVEKIEKQMRELLTTVNQLEREGSSPKIRDYADSLSYGLKEDNLETIAKLKTL